MKRKSGFSLIFYFLLWNSGYFYIFLPLKVLEKNHCTAKKGSEPLDLTINQLIMKNNYFINNSPDISSVQTVKC